MTINLLSYSNSGGCGCKIEPKLLRDILSQHKLGEENQLFVDFLHKDDASVLEISPENCLIQTVDFFLPIVNIPFDFGMISAANAISDVYAMGGNPVSALAILGWPKENLSLESASEVLKGAELICNKAGISISGGHSIHTIEPIFGLSVNGLAEKKYIKRKNTTVKGDLIYLSKPLGLGLLANALKNGSLSLEGYQTFLNVSTRLNDIGLKLGKTNSVTAMTDVTGFGLLGHLGEMLTNGKGAILNLKDIPVIAEAKEIANKMMYPNITTNNYNDIKDRCDGLDGLEFLYLCDPQTSGGLLFTSSEKIEPSIAICIGEITDSGRISII